MNRFIDAQREVYECVVSELKFEKKTTHWMWYIFPQLKALGKSKRAIYYGLADEAEARLYCNDNILHSRYLECCEILLNTVETDPEKIFGCVDAVKLKSSLTLFYIVDEGNRHIYKCLIDKFFEGQLDQLTTKFLSNNP